MTDTATIQPRMTAWNRFNAATKQPAGAGWD
jgi:hypothetical protein